MGVIAIAFGAANINILRGNNMSNSSIQSECVQVLSSGEAINPCVWRWIYKAGTYIFACVGAYYEYQSEYGNSNGALGYSDVYEASENGRPVFKKEVRCDYIQGANECQPGQVHGYITVG